PSSRAPISAVPATRIVGVLIVVSLPLPGPGRSIRPAAKESVTGHRRSSSTAAIRGVIAIAARMSVVCGRVTAMTTTTVDQAPATQAVLQQVLSGLHVSLLDVAETAHVQRPVV